MEHSDGPSPLRESRLKASADILIFVVTDASSEVAAVRITAGGKLHKTAGACGTETSHSYRTRVD